MPLLEIDATEAKSFEPIEDGEYECSVREISEAKKGPKSTYVVIQFEIADGDYAGRRLFRNYPITGPGAGFFLDLWGKAVGEPLDQGEITSIDTDDLVGKPIRVVTEQSEYEGNIRSEVKRILAV